MDELLGQLSTEPWYRKQVACVVEVPPRPGQWADPPPELPEQVRAWLSSHELQLYHHQAEAASHLLHGRDVVLSTGPSSGKTLAMALPVLSTLLREPQATALLIYPMKALAQDQLVKWQTLADELGVEGWVGVYDGDTPAHRRPRLREQGRVLLTNPYALHHYLSWHHLWAKFFRGLRFVVVDEGHWYRGVFGSGVALVLRRLERILRRYGARWTYALATATAGDPQALGERLLGRPVEVVSEDTSPQGRRVWWFWDPDRDPQRSLFQQAVHLCAFLGRQGRQTLAFVSSRKMAEMLAVAIREVEPDLAVATYRAGYRPEERRELEQGLRSGALQVVVSTCALELGIDIGGLDAVVLVGHPGTAASVRQQSGRAGRAGRDALIVYLPQEDPLDRYYLARPQELVFGRSEAVVVNPRHRELVLKHTLCAASEAPLTAEDLPLLGAQQGDVCSLEGAGLLARTARGWSYAGRTRPQEVVALEALSSRQVQLVVEGQVLETWDEVRARREAFPGAIVLHQGELYRVRELRLDEGVAVLEPAPYALTTKALTSEQARILEVWEACRGLGWGKIKVVERVLGYELVDRGRLVEVRHLDLPPIEFESEGVWLTWSEVPGEVREVAGGLHGAEHALVALVPLVVECETRDVGGVSTPLHPDTDRPTVLVYDGFPDGLGIAEALYRRASEWVGRTVALLESCRCEDGCPRCVLSPRCGNRNQPMDKEAARALLRGWCQRG